MALNNPDAYAATINHGQYTGNNTASRAITHGLGKIPKFVFILELAGAYNWGAEMLDGAGSLIFFNNLALQSRYYVPPSTDTYFYVGHATNYSHSCNAAGIDYTWVAFA